MIIDMGGTTSDIALMQNGKTVSSLSGIRIGNWATMVNGKKQAVRKSGSHFDEA